MSAPHLRNIGSYLKPVHTLSPAASSAGARNGSAVDRLGYESAQIVVQTGATTGTPTSFTVDAKIQDSADGSTGWADYTAPGATAVAALTTLITADSTAKFNVDLSGAKRYVRVVQTIAFVAGTSPTLLNNAAVVLGGAVSVNALPTP
jgi:hypothetical protein